MVIVEEREIGQGPVIQLSLSLQIIGGDKPRWFVFLKDEQIDWFDTYSDAKDRLGLLETLSNVILIQYFGHKECDVCDELYKDGVKTYEYVTKGSPDSNAGTWTATYCLECYLSRKEDKDTVSIVEVVPEQ